MVQRKRLCVRHHKFGFIPRYSVICVMMEKSQIFTSLNICFLLGFLLSRLAMDMKCERAR